MSYVSVIIGNVKPKSSANTSCFLIYDHPGGHLLINAQRYNWTAVLLLNPYKSKQTMIYNSHDLWSPGVLKYHHLLGYLFIHAPTTDGEKTRYRCIGWFHSKPAHVFIMHNKSKTTWGVRAICCLCCSFIAGQNDKLLCKLRRWRRMHINGTFPISLRFCRVKMNNCRTFCDKIFFFLLSLALDILFMGQKQAEISESLCSILYSLYGLHKLGDTFNSTLITSPFLLCSFLVHLTDSMLLLGVRAIITWTATFDPPGSVAFSIHFESLFPFLF